MADLMLVVVFFLQLVNRDFTSEIEILKKTNSDLNSTVIDKDTQISILNKDIDRFKMEKSELQRNLTALQAELRDRCDKLRSLECTVVSWTFQYINKYIYIYMCVCTCTLLIITYLYIYTAIICGNVQQHVVTNIVMLLQFT